MQPHGPLGCIGSCCCSPTDEVYVHCKSAAEDPTKAGSLKGEFVVGRRRQEVSISAAAGSEASIGAMPNPAAAAAAAAAVAAADRSCTYTYTAASVVF